MRKYCGNLIWKVIGYVSSGLNFDSGTEELICLDLRFSFYINSGGVTRSHLSCRCFHLAWKKDCSYRDLKIGLYRMEK